MTLATLVLRGLRFHARTNLGVLAGCALSTAVLAGALFVGDSARASLSRGALARLGGVVSAMETGSRTFADDLPARMDGVRAAAALRVAGMALREGRQVNAVDVIGVDAAFFGFGQDGPPLRSGEVALGGRLAAELGARPGDEVSLRVFQPGLLSRDAPLASRGERETRRGRFRVAAVLSDGRLGRFSLKSDQSAPANAFLELRELQRMIEREGRANLLVCDAPADRAQAALRDAWRLEDAGLVVRPVAEHGLVQLQTPRIYLDPAVSQAALAAAAPSAGMLSYLVDALEANGRSTPYSFMTALTPGALGPVPADMADDEILVNRWVADHLSLKKGDLLAVRYSELVAGQTFKPRARTFRVRDVLPMESLAAERALVPDFPGLTDVEACANWDIGLPMDEKKLKDEANEKYWERWKQTPKAFVTLAAGRAMWANPFGDLMAVRWRAADAEPAALTEAVRRGVDPASLGLLLRPVREQALAAAEGSMDLGQLFLGLSLFLVAASLLLTALLFAFAIEQRAREMGILLAVGHRPGRVRGLFLAEGAVLAAGGALAGLPLGALFAKGLLAGLSGAWSGAVAGAAIAFHATAPSAAIAAVAGFVVSFGAMALAAGRQARRPVRELVAEDFTLAVESRAPAGGRRWAVAAAVALAGALAAAGAGLASGAPAPAFFAAGALALAGGVAAVRALMGRLSTASAARLSIATLGARNAARRPGRAVAAAGMLACGAFMVVAVSAMKEDLGGQAGRRDSGTGGFALVGEASVAVHHDLNTARGREALRLSEEDLAGVSVVPLKVREGDDASCLNLNLSLSPPLLGVDPDALATRGAFGPPELWSGLGTAVPEGVVPALVGDSATALWKLRKKVGPDGDLLDYRDERGRPFKVKLVGQIPSRLSVFQGRLLVSSRDFLRLYPSESGWRLFLVDAPADRADAVDQRLTSRLETYGLDLVAPVERLRQYYEVESAYLAMFLVLGGLGLLLGSAGMGVLVLRSVLERRSELALLTAVGYTKARAAAVVVAEHRLLLMAGLAAGTAAAALAIAPSAARPDVQVPYGLLAGFLAGTALLGLGWIWAAARVALRGPLVAALRNE